jgi:hypothetical protein
MRLVRAATTLTILALAALVAAGVTGVTQLMMDLPRFFHTLHVVAAWTTALAASAAFLNARSRWLAIAAGAAIAAHASGPLTFLSAPTRWLHIAVLPAITLAMLIVSLVKR